MSIIFSRYSEHAASLAAIVSDLHTVLADIAAFDVVIPSSVDVCVNICEAVKKIQDVEDLLFTAAETLSDEGF